MDSIVGRTLGHYRITSLLGQGGMGAVYRAEDTQLGRDVAVKILPTEVAGDPDRLRRFQREARAAAALNHPAIVTIHSVEEHDGIHFLTLELVDGQPLGQRIPGEGMALDAFFAVAEPLTQALAAAHTHGIVHRDIKPANVMVTRTGETKVLDFGLARIDPGVPDETAPTQTSTQLGAVVGTPGYMSPEQARGLPVDVRTDVFSTGIVLYEMLTGRQPFRRGDTFSTTQAVVQEDPEKLAVLRPDVPEDLAQLITRCLKKQPAERFASAVELAAELKAARERIVREGAAWQPRRLLVPALLALVLVVAFGIWWSLRDRQARRIRAETIPSIEALLDDGDSFQAFELAQAALQALPDDPLLRRLSNRSSFPVTIRTRPAGAEVAFRRYRDPAGKWQPLGTTPIEHARVPADYLALRVEKSGFESALFAFGGFRFDLELLPEGSSPEGMLRVPEGLVALGTVEPKTVPAFWIGRHEVSNAEFQRFVDAGGYTSADAWLEPFVAGGRTLSPEEARSRFVDATGRPGPAGWELGRYPEGKSDHPVSGVSWYEAQAYAHWAGKSLPTVYHWKRAAGSDVFSDILTLSNFGGEDTAPVGRYRGLGPFGTYDMAGNVKEWCVNPTGSKRYALGGGFNESPYLFTEDDARDPFDRSANQGFRLVRDDAPLPAEFYAMVGDTRYDFSKVERVSNEIYDFFAGLYDYAPRDLDARVDRVDDESPDWRYEAISVVPAYSGPRLVIHLFLPRNAAAPYQVVVNRPNASINFLTHIEDYANLPYFIPRSGRALAIPAYWGTLNRRSESGDARERVVHQVQDFRRTLDYLETREDIDDQRMAYSGMSAGGEYAPVYLAVEPRVKTAVLVGAGFHDAHMLAEPPETNPWNFSSRVTIPTLIINGENDFTLPREFAQQPFYEMLGTDPAHKRFVTISGGHVTTDRNTRIRETLNWLDRYLGPVEPRTR